MDGRRWADATTPDAAGWFADAVLGAVPADPGSSRGRDAAYCALELHRDGANAGFVRPSADLAVVVVSDLDDDSGQITLDQFVGYLQTLKWDEAMTRFSSVVALAGVPLCPDAVEAGLSYQAITDAVGGVAWSICALGPDLFPALIPLPAPQEPWFYLRQIPEPDSIDVVFQHDNVTIALEPLEHWNYYRVPNAVRLTAIPPFPSEVWVSYELGDPYARPDVPASRTWGL